MQGREDGGKLVSDENAEQRSLFVCRIGRHGISVGSLLARAGSRLGRNLARQKDLVSYIRDRIGAFEQIDGVILPPSSQYEIKAGSGAGVEPPVEHPRLAELLASLAENNVHLDQMSLTSGEVGPSSWRQKSYIKVIIPAHNADVLVCDQVGEATFVVKPSQSATDHLSLTKVDLYNMPEASRVIYRSKPQWLNEIGDLVSNHSSKDV